MNEVTATTETPALATCQARSSDRINSPDGSRSVALNRNALLAVLFLMTMNPLLVRAEKMLFDFSGGANPQAWQVVNDEVMGGISRSRFELSQGVAVFSGEVSLEHNGGFASVRSQSAEYDLSGCEAFLIRVRGDGRTYKFTARTHPNFDGVLYQANFCPPAGKWTEHRLPLSAFAPTFRGRRLTGVPALNPAKVASVGFLISDKQAGPFRLEVAWIKAVRLSQSEH